MAKTQPVDWKKVGHYAFIAGILVAAILAFIDVPEKGAIGILIVLGLIVGLLNITVKETLEFLVAALVLLVSASVTALSLGIIHTRLTAIWGNVITFIAFAAIIVAIKTVYVLAEKK